MCPRKVVGSPKFLMLAGSNVAGFLPVDQVPTHENRVKCVSAVGVSPRAFCEARRFWWSARFFGTCSLPRNGSAMARGGTSRSGSDPAIEPCELDSNWPTGSFRVVALRSIPQSWGGRVFLVSTNLSVRPEGRGAADEGCACGRRRRLGLQEPGAPYALLSVHF